MGGDDDLCTAHDLGDIEPGGAGEVCLRQIDLTSAEDRHDIAAFEIFRHNPFMDAGEDAGAVDKVFGRIARVGVAADIRTGIGFPVLTLIPVPAAIPVPALLLEILALLMPIFACLPPVVMPFMMHMVFPLPFPFSFPFGVFVPGATGAQHDQEADEDEDAWPDEPVKLCMWVVVLEHKGEADQHEDRPGAAAEVMAEPDE